MRRVKPDNFFCYLKNIGVPISGAKLHVMDWLPLDEEVLKKIDGWKGGSLPFGSYGLAPFG
jgi:hypothetical protein